MTQQTIHLGDFQVLRMGLGTNQITDTPEARNLLEQALELGVQLIDTADVYTYGASETTIGNNLAPYREGLVIATKGGLVRGAPNDASPAALKKALDASLKRLQVERIDLYQLHRPDPKVPFEASVSALRELQQAGKIRHIGLSNVDIPQLEAARAIVPIVSVQNEYSLNKREQEEMLAYCTRESLAFLPYFPLGAGRLKAPGSLLNQLAERYEVTATQLTLAWLLSRSPLMLPIPGTLSQAHLRENVAALQIQHDDADAESLSQAEV